MAAGVRRIEAVTGERALDLVSTLQDRARQVAQLVRATATTFPTRSGNWSSVSGNWKGGRQAKARLASGQGADLLGQTVQVDGVKVLAARLDGVDAKTLREAVDRYKDQLKAAAVVLATVEDGKVRLVAGVTSAETRRLKAGDLVNMVAQQVGGKGRQSSRPGSGGWHRPLETGYRPAVRARLDSWPTRLKSTLRSRPAQPAPNFFYCPIKLQFLPMRIMGC